MTPIYRHPAFAWFAALGWTALVCVLMLLPGEDSAAKDTSDLFGGTDLTDAIGHALLFGMLAGLLFRAWSQHLPARRALGWALGVTLLLGTGLEVTQSWIPERGAALLDFGANWLGALLIGAWTHRRAATPTDQRHTA
jgi:VanZ family protein